jgi:hypothetical protein
VYSVAEIKKEKKKNLESQYKVNRKYTESSQKEFPLFGPV